jgi:hypothetical protein
LSLSAFFLECCFGLLSPLLLLLRPLSFLFSPLLLLLRPLPFPNQTLF